MRLTQADFNTIFHALNLSESEYSGFPVYPGEEATKVSAYYHRMTKRILSTRLKLKHLKDSQSLKNRVAKSKKERR